jgi:hypothetical protein
MHGRDNGLSPNVTRSKITQHTLKAEADATGSGRSGNGRRAGLTSPAELRRPARGSKRFTDAVNRSWSLRRYIQKGMVRVSRWRRGGGSPCNPQGDRQDAG